MIKKKLGIASISLIALMGIGVAAYTTNGTMAFRPVNGENYNFSLNETTGLTGETNLGRKIKFSSTIAPTPLEGTLGKFAVGSVIKNDIQISGIQSIDIVYTGKLNVSWGFNKTASGVEELSSRYMARKGIALYSAEGTYTNFGFYNEMPSYIELNVEEEAVITSLKVNYSCSEVLQDKYTKAWGIVSNADGFNETFKSLELNANNTNMDFVEYFAKGVSLKAGQVISFRNGDEWNDNNKWENAGAFQEGRLEKVDNGFGGKNIKVHADGLYDFYLKNGAYSYAGYTKPTNKLVNGDFESGNLHGWKLISGEISDHPVCNFTTYWGEEIPFNKNGEYFFNGWEATQNEPAGYALQSDKFTLDGTGFISFKLGGRVATLRVFKADGSLIGEYGNPRFQDKAFPHVSQGCRLATMNSYYLDLSAHLGEELYIELADLEGGNWGIAMFDDINVYYEDVVDFASKVDTLTQKGTEGEFTLPWTEAVAK